MQTTGVGNFLGLAVATLRDPKGSLRIVLDIVITMSELLQATALVVVLSMILPVTMLILQPIEDQNALNAFALNPVPAVGVQMVILIVTAGLISLIGRVFGGYGTFKEALTAMVWLQFVLIGVQIAQLILGIISPQLGAIVFLLSMLIMVYLTVNFIMEIHGFSNTGAVIFGVVGCFFGVAFILSIFLILLGYTPEAIQNV